LDPFSTVLPQIMINRCPACAARLEYQVLDHQAGGGVNHCRTCGHEWLEGKAIEVSVEPMRSVPVTLEHASMPDGEIHHLVSASRLALDAFQLKRRHKRITVAGWIALFLVAISPAAMALLLPERLVAAAPAAISFYDWLGQDVNIYGLEIQNVELQHLQAGGQRVIAIKGELSNVSNGDRKIPWLRFGLNSGDGKEVYQWRLDTRSRPLRPGETKSFFTRVASPPETAISVEIRFARADEIGSNMVP
jgi:hypothetical protein